MTGVRPGTVASTSGGESARSSRKAQIRAAGWSREIREMYSGVTMRFSVTSFAGLPFLKTSLVALRVPEGLGLVARVARRGRKRVDIA